MKAVKARKTARSFTKMKSFLGACSVFRGSYQILQTYRRHLVINFKYMNFSTSNRNRKRWQRRKSLRHKLISPPALALPFAEARMTLHRNACKVRVGCLLQQEKPVKTSKLASTVSVNSQTQNAHTIRRNESALP